MIFDDLRVVDESHRLAGAYCAKLLADLGADVVRVEPERGDAARADGLDGAFWSYLRTSQRSVTRADAWRGAADILIVDELPEAPGNVPVTVAISALGSDGPDRHLNAIELPEPVLQARSGALAGHGHMQQPPLTVAGDIGEYVAGAMAALAAATVVRRAQRGVPETIDVSVLEAMQLTMLTMPTLFANFPGGRKASFRFVMIPGNEPCGDGNFAGITTNTIAQWKALLHAAGRDDLVDDAELHTMLGRFLRADDVHAALHGWTLEHSATEVEAACIANRVPVAIVGNGKLLLEFDHLRERAVFVGQPGAEFVRPRAPFRLHGVGDQPLTPAPAVGEHDGDTPWPPRSQPDGGTATAGARPLAGVRVLDCTAFWAGPSATAWLAAMGADVIKVESCQRPDGMRMSGTTRHGQPDALECSPLYHASNLDKRGITLDLSRNEGVELARRLIATCDVVAENFTPRVMEGFGLDEAAVRAIRPDVVMLRLPAFGLTGPWRDRPGFAQTMEQLSGMAWATGYAGGPPIIAGGVVDPMVGAHAALAVIAALDHRARTGEGQLVEVAMVEVAVATTARQVIRYQRTGDVGDRRGTRGVYRTAGDDEWIAIDDTRDPMPPDERAEWCATRNHRDAERELLAAGLAAFAAVPGYAALDDPQLIAREFFEPLTHSVVGEQWFPRFPMRMSGGPHRFWNRPAPTLGEHNDEILTGELGLTAEQMERLRAERIIGDTAAAASPP